ncbi:hypothetical protein ACFY30_30250 [Streptomyces sp. NPDC000345]|uniref:hypothetical protein n=1 Tax=Streptomyces sp. NPDC000345 TaxID=3364537 RepID=UPI0036AAFD6B
MGTTPLGSWNDGSAKRAIVGFVTSAAVEGSPGFVAPMDRAAVFDDDGTLWVEKPAPVQMAFVLGKLAARLPRAERTGPRPRGRARPLP